MTDVEARDREAREGAVEEGPSEEPPDPSADLVEMEDRWKRALADLDNYRKRSVREIDRQVAERSERLVRDWLDAVDSVERALASAPPTNPLAEGFRQVLEQMEAIMERQGVSRIGTVGEPFDPQRHEAVGVRSTNDLPDQTIADVARSGYMLGDRVLRPAQVVVSRAGEAAEDGS